MKEGEDRDGNGRREALDPQARKRTRLRGCIAIGDSLSKSIEYIA